MSSCAWPRTPTSASRRSRPKAGRRRVDSRPPRSPDAMTPRVRRTRRRPQLSRRHLTALVEEALIDAHGESEQRVGLLTMLQEHLAVPFTTEILATPVRVTRIDLNDAD